MPEDRILSVTWLVGDLTGSNRNPEGSLTDLQKPQISIRRFKQDNAVVIYHTGTTAGIFVGICHVMRRIEHYE